LVLALLQRDARFIGVEGGCVGDGATGIESNILERVSRYICPQWRRCEGHGRHGYIEAIQ
jgi:hypothetical protein